LQALRSARTKASEPSPACEVAAMNARSHGEKAKALVLGTQAHHET